MTAETIGAASGLRAATARARVVLSTVVAAVLGVAPHVLHHVGPLAGAALLGGVGGSLLFGAAGLLLAVPFLLRVRRRCGGWRLPVALLVTFATVFAVSTFVVGPAISSEGSPPATSPQPAGHEEHH